MPQVAYLPRAIYFATAHDRAFPLSIDRDLVRPALFFPKLNG